MPHASRLTRNLTSEKELLPPPRGGWKHIEAIKGDISLAELTKELWAYSTQVRWVDQKAGCLAVTHRRAEQRSWIARSIWLLVWGWYRDSRQTCKANWGPLPETLSWGIPWNLKTCWIRGFAVSWVEGSIFKGIKCKDFCWIWSIVLRTTVLPSDGGNPVRNSTTIWDRNDKGSVEGAGSQQTKWWLPSD